MIKSVYIDGHNNYFIDQTTGIITDKYDSENKNLSVHLTLENSILDISNENIKSIYGDLVIIQYGNDRFIIDDGYQNNLIKAGYIVYKNYDTMKENDPAVGMELRNSVVSKVNKVLKSLSENIKYNTCLYNINDNEMELVIEYEYSNVTINISTVSEIVIKNKHRKDNSLPFYAFDKNIDKYGSVYLSIFNQVKEKNIDDSAPIFKANNLTKMILDELGTEYHFVSQIVKKSVIKHKDL